MHKPLVAHWHAMAQPGQGEIGASDPHENLQAAPHFMMRRICHVVADHLCSGQWTRGPAVGSVAHQKGLHLTDFRTLGVTMAICGQAALADPVTELRCTEAAWQQATAKLQDNRDAVWARMDAWLERPAQADCTALPGPEVAFTWQCGAGAAQFETTVGFEPVNRDRLDRMQGWVFLARLGAAFNSPEMTEAFTQLEEDLTEVLVDLAEFGVTVTPIEPEPAPQEDVPEISVSDMIADMNPLQNSLGLTATISWQQETEENALTRVDDILRVHELLQALERGDPSRDNTIAQAAAANAEVVALAAQQSNFWSDAHMPLAASRFQLFGQPTDVVRHAGDGISVIDIASWSQSTDASGPMIEGVEEMVFYYAPQPDFAQSVDAGGDCKVMKTFPCPPLNSGGSVGQSRLGDVPPGCATAEGCDFAALRWVSDHVAVRTHLQARQADVDALEQFAARLTTLRTKSLLNAFAPDEAFDPAVSCQ